MDKCFYCYQGFSESDRTKQAAKRGFHESCSRKMFGKSVPPELPYTEDDFIKLGDAIINSHKSVPGVQPKLSVGIERIRGVNESEKLTIVGILGEYILKPQTKVYKNLPEIEDVTMHLAEIAGIKTVRHSLIALKSGQLAYITKRVDRTKNGKLHMEDMCQLTERPTEHKYRGSYEQIAKTILKYAANSYFNVINFYEQVIFSFLTGNNDMHLKNFSLLKDETEAYNLCPAYDMVASELVLDDNEELALNLNGKKRELRRKDFEIALKGGGLDPKTIENIFNKFKKALPEWHAFIDNSFLPLELKEKYHVLINLKSEQLDLDD
ncbi:HipA domain-containing protein [Roseivirga seohaensis]|uniref:HipA domain-containing protein n=1 Tax=Roseivirga seohaensis TaxID=1914963 RepID=UPI003BAC0D09